MYLVVIDEKISFRISDLGIKDPKKLDMHCQYRRSMSSFLSNWTEFGVFYEKNTNRGGGVVVNPERWF